MGNKQDGFSYVDKSKQNNKGKIERNKKLFWTTFWTLFIGSSVLVAIPLWLSTLSEKPAQESKNQTKPVKTVVKVVKRFENVELIKYIEGKKKEILARAWEKSEPQIEQLRIEITSEISDFTNKALNRYFEKIETQNVDKFLDWLYSFGTDYKIAIFAAKEEVDKFLNSRDCIKNGNIEGCKKFVKPSGYLEQQVSKYLLNPNDLRIYLEIEIFPHYKQSLDYFVKKSFEILKKEIKSTAEEELKEKFPDIDGEEIEKIVDNFMVQIEPTLRMDVLKRISQKVTTIVTLTILKKIIVKEAKVLPKKVATKIAYKMAEKIAAKMAVKTGSKLAGAGSGFATGTAVCIEFGPFAVLCGVAAALAAAVATDYTINKVDELMNRDDFKIELIKDLENSKKELYSALRTEFKSSINSVEFEMRKIFGGGDIKLKEIPNLEKG